MPLRATRSPVVPGAQIELRDAVWRVERVDATSTGTHAWRCVGVSEIVCDLEAVFLEEYEPEVRVLDPRETRLERDASSQHQAGLLYIESLLRQVPPPADGLYVGHRAAMDLLDFQLDPAWKALSQPRHRILIADAVGLGKTLEAGRPERTTPMLRSGPAPPPPPGHNAGRRRRRARRPHRRCGARGRRAGRGARGAAGP